MKIFFRILLIAITCLWWSFAFAGESYFIDLDARINGNGSFQQPWNNIHDVNNFKFKVGDDVYFKCGTISSGSENLIVHWSGTDNDKIIIGAYYTKNNEPIFGINTDGRPIIQGKIDSFPTVDNGLIHIQGFSHVTIKDLKLYNSGAQGIFVKGPAEYISVNNVYVQNTRQHGILFIKGTGGGVKNSIIENSTIERAIYNSFPGASICINSGYIVGEVSNIIIRKNTVFHGAEGIGLYKGPTYITVENNVVYDNRAVQMYTDRGGHHQIWRNNIVYESKERWSTNGTILFAMNNEGHNLIVNESYRDNEYYGNYIAGGKIGFSLGNSSSDSGLVPSNIKIYDNRIVDCMENIKIWSSFNGKNIEIKNNVSGIYESGGKHVVEQGNTAEIIWYQNKFNSSVKGDAENNAIIFDMFVEKTGWRSLQSGGVKESDFTINADNGGSTSNAAGTTSNSQQIILLKPPKPINLTVNPGVVKIF